ncbi:peptidoglycan recognition protein 1-like [Ruditapes philippinarum]|uniref:peptidoglycan recognition protein 1-like n=1 Tax=Ruditapes philippinarum TaxID=129788 RepID=UPI00295A8934|nr:peptidoglycan recognition protein 1-like [Ruditapes philippinarum]
MFSIILTLLGLVGLHYVKCTQCACATTNVHVRDGPGLSHTILTILFTDQCLSYKGHRQTVNETSWVNVDYHGHNGWIHEGFVTLSPCVSSNVTNKQLQLPGCPKIITRTEWGARDPISTYRKLHHPVKYMFIHHGASDFCFTRTDCIQMMKNYQTYQIDFLGFTDIGYSFVVGEDGNVYEARGWDAVGAHTYGYNDVGLAICVIGDFTNRVPNDAAVNAVKQMIACGLSNGKLSNTYLLRGARDVETTASPGEKLYDLIKTWPHY